MSWLARTVGPGLTCVSSRLRQIISDYMGDGGARKGSPLYASACVQRPEDGEQPPAQGLSPPITTGAPAVSSPWPLWVTLLKPEHSWTALSCSPVEACVDKEVCPPVCTGIPMGVCALGCRYNLFKVSCQWSLAEVPNAKRCA